VSFGGLRVNEVRVEVDRQCLVTLSGTIYLTCGECGRDLMRADVSREWFSCNRFDTLEEDDENRCKYKAIEAPELEAIEEVDGKRQSFQRFDGEKKKYGVQAHVLVKRNLPFRFREERVVWIYDVVEADAFKECG
jgi:hypothetical protein